MTAPFFPGVRPHLSSVFATDWTDYPVGVQPFDWVKATSFNDFTAIVETVEGGGQPAHSGKALRWTRTLGGFQTFNWSALETTANCEVLMRYRRIEAMDAGQVLLGVTVRGSWTAGSGSDFTGYRVVPYRDDAVNRTTLQRLAAGSVVVDYPDVVISGGTPGGNDWVWLRFRVVGSSFQHAAWLSGTPEPAMHTDIDAVVTQAGPVGLHTVGGHPDLECDYFACALPEGSNPPASIPIPF